MIESIAERGARGHLVMITDPVEESFPFIGNTEFVDVDSPARLRVGQAETFRQTIFAVSPCIAMPLPLRHVHAIGP